MFGPHRDFASWWIMKMPFAVVENPFELYISFLCMIAGVPYLIADVHQPGVSYALPAWGTRAWGGLLVLGGLLVMLGLLRRNSVIERAGLWPLSLASIVFGIASLYRFSPTTIAPAILVIGFGIACISRIILLSAAHQILKKVNSAAE